MTRKCLFLMLAFFAAVVVLLPCLTAQEKATPSKSGVVEVSPPPALLNRLTPGLLGGGAGPNVRANQDVTPEPQNETTIAVNPADPYNIVGGANDYRNGDATVGWYTSFDGGLTWTDGVFPIPGNYDASGDPAVAFGPNNRVYFAQLIFQRDSQNPPSGIYVSTSTDGGLTWNAQVNVSTSASSEFDDKELIACDTTGGTYNGNVYVSWTKFGFGSPIYLSRSTDAGQTFSTPMNISDTSNNQGSMPAIGPNGEVYVVWKDYNSDRIRFDRSVNGGASFGSDRTVADTDSVGFPLSGFAFRGNSFPYIAVDKSGGSNHGRIYCVWNDDRNGDADIYMAWSDNQGTSWTQPKRVNDDSLSNGEEQFFPFVTVTEGGALDVTYYDTGYGSHSLLDMTLIRSGDGGLTFDPSIRVTDQSFDPANDGFGGAFIGDYNGMASTDNATYPLWTDCRNGNDSDAYCSRVELAFQSDRDTVSASSPLPTLFSLDAGSGRAGRNYLIVAGASGTSPGTPVGSVTVPINQDGVTNWVLANIGNPAIAGFWGALDSDGRGSGTFGPSAAHLAGIVGLTLDFAFVALSPVNYSSQPLSLAVLP
jgi:hypothetical protein